MPQVRPSGVAYVASIRVCAFDTDTNEVVGATAFLDGVKLNHPFTAEVHNDHTEVWGMAGGPGYLSQSFLVKNANEVVVFLERGKDPAPILPVVFTTKPTAIACTVIVGPAGGGASQTVTTVISTVTQSPEHVSAVPDPSGNNHTIAQAVVFNLVPGLYGVVASAPNYQLCETTFTLPGGEEVDLNFVAIVTGDPGLPDGGQPAAPSDNIDIIAALAGPPKMDAATFEKIYGNSDFEHYFTSVQARVYIGTLFVDEMQSIQYAVQTNVVPIYGYASRFADAWGDGKSLVQGQLVINYVSEAYMFTLLDEYQNLQDSTAAIDIPPGQQNGKDLANILASIRANKTKAISAGTVQMQQLEDQILALASTPDAVQAAKRALRDQGFDAVYMNASYMRIPFDMTVEIGIGDIKTYRKMENCRIISNEQILDQSGNVVGDSYGFIARRLR